MSRQIIRFTANGFFLFCFKAALLKSVWCTSKATVESKTYLYNLLSYIKTSLNYQNKNNTHIGWTSEWFKWAFWANARCFTLIRMIIERSVWFPRWAPCVLWAFYWLQNQNWMFKETRDKKKGWLSPHNLVINDTKIMDIIEWDSYMSSAHQGISERWFRFSTLL